MEKFKSIGIMLLGVMIVLYGMWFMFGWDGVRLTLYILLMVTGSNLVIVGVMSLYDNIKDDKKVSWRRWNMERLWDKFCLWVALRLPIRLVGWCYIRVIAHASSGQWSNSSITGLQASTALERWYTCNVYR